MNNKQVPFDFPKGEVLLIDKPLQWTSFDVVNKIRFSLKHICGIPKIKVGHAGTLDPMATGLLIICTGKATRQIDTYQAEEKEYTGTFMLGKTTPSFDRETEPDKIYPVKHITETLLHETAQTFYGIQEQIPPVFSAVKYKGKRAYQMARKNEEVKLNPRQIEISAFDITRILLPEVDFRIVCSKGTYIRSVARDFGFAMNSGAYLSDLKRTRIGNFKLEDALSLETFQETLMRLYEKNT
jgi:tRNA pseudouridine55 synthase